MVLINLKDYYPAFYKDDSFVWISDEVYNEYCKFELEEKNEHRNKRRRPKNVPFEDFYIGDRHLLSPPMPLVDIVQKNLDAASLHEAISKLSPKQAHRIFAHFFLGLSKTEIAEMEGVNKVQVTKSIHKALRFLRNELKK